MDLKARTAIWTGLAGKGEEEIGKSEKEGMEGEKKREGKMCDYFYNLNFIYNTYINL